MTKKLAEWWVWSETYCSLLGWQRKEMVEIALDDNFTTRLSPQEEKSALVCAFDDPFQGPSETRVKPLAVSNDRNRARLPTAQIDESETTFAQHWLHRRSIECSKTAPSRGTET